MSGEITTIKVSSIMAAISAPIGAWVASRLMKSKYQAEIAGLRAEIEEKLTGVRSSELDNVRKANDLLLDSVVAPLKKEMSSLRKDVEKFRKAIERIPTCTMADQCPVSRKLRDSEEDDDNIGKESSNR